MSVLADVDLAKGRVRPKDGLTTRNMAAATLCRYCKVIAQMLEPLPLKNAPSAPAFSAAAITSGRNGINFFRKG